MKKQPAAAPWTVREWGSFASIIGTVILVWMTFGPRSKHLLSPLASEGAGDPGLGSGN